MAMKKLPDGIRDFLEYLGEIQGQKPLIQEEIQRMDRLTEDYLNKMEQPLSGSERTKVAKALGRCRQIRRQLINQAAAVQLVTDFSNSGRGASALGQLEALAEKIQALEEAPFQSSYQPQVMSLEEYNKL